jgi:polysaccharide deacetylase family protein (PEP-CTERM system associated)
MQSGGKITRITIQQAPQSLQRNYFIMMNMLTVDVEDYYHVSSFETVIRPEDWDCYESRVERHTYRILDILDAYDTKATFFVLGWVAERHPALVRELAQRGHEVASHGYSHRRVYTQTPAQFREETRRSKGIIEEIIEQPIIGYRAASYSITNRSLWALDILIEEGFLYDSSIFPIVHDRYGIPDAKRYAHFMQNRSGLIYEYPLSTIRVGRVNVPIGGGGYLRIFPYFLNKWGIKRLNNVERRPAIVYLHPWELDPEQPRLKGSALSHFRHYHNLHKTEGVLRSLLQDFQFGKMKDLYGLQQENDLSEIAIN